MTKLSMSLYDECNELLGEKDQAESDEWLVMLMNKSLISREKYLGGWSVLKKSSKGMQCWKSPAKAAITAVHEMLQDGQTEVVSLRNPRQEQYRRKQNLLNFRVIFDEKTDYWKLSRKIEGSRDSSESQSQS